MFYTVDALVESPIMLIDRQIGDSEDEGIGMDGALFGKELMSLDGMGKKSIQIWVNTPGGNMFQGYMMLNAILQSKTPVDTYNIGVVASMGFPIFMAGRKRYMMDYAVAMIHMPFDKTGVAQNKELQKFGDSMVTMIASRSNLSEKKIREMCEAETWLNAQECLKYGFATEIMSSAVTKKYYPMSAKGKTVNMVWSQAKTIAAQLVNDTKRVQPNSNNQLKNNTMSRKIMAKLKLNEEASEESAVEAITAIETQAYNAETKIIQLTDAHTKALQGVKEQARLDSIEAKKVLDGVQAKLTATEAALAAKQAEFDTVNAQYIAMKEEKEAAVAAKKLLNATALVTAHLNTRIENKKEVIDRWVAIAVADYDNAKAMIEAIPLNVKAPKVTETFEVGAEGNRVLASAEGKMQMIAMKHGQK